jgi:5-methylcytosine-specific restriction protein B
MELINDLFQEWKKNYKRNEAYDDIIKRINDIKIIDYDFLKHLLHSKHNGLGSHGGNYVDLSDNNTKLIAETIQKIKQEINFNYQANSTEIGKLGFKSEKRNMPIVYNRVLCALKPDELCNIPGEKQVNELLIKFIELGIEHKVFLDSNSKKIEKKDILKKNWYEKNNAICEILDKEIDFTNKNQNYQSHRNNFAWYLYIYFSTDFSISKQIIKYGAPGTGKTYLTAQECENYFDSWNINKSYDNDFKEHYEFVQFHPSYTYEDFIEGIRPSKIAEGSTQLELKDGIFKSFCKKAAKWELELYNLGLGKGNDDESFERITVKDVKEKETAHLKSIIENRKDDELIKDLIPPYFFVIDEINRAELSRVFGELMYCLEYRGYGGKVKTQYSELASDENIFYKEKEGDNNYFFIPHNVYIIGTMNTIDRSVESFDFALRRRFLWQRIDPNYEVLEEYFNERDFKEEEAKKIVDGLKKLNEDIKKNPLLGEDYQIGHSYLMKREQYTGLKPKQYKEKIWEKHIQPILEEYFRGMGENKGEIDKLKEKFIPKEEKTKSNEKDKTA